MRAADLQVALPVVRRETTAVEAGRLIAEGSLVGLVVANNDGVPVAILSAVDVLQLMLPDYVLDDPWLAGVFDEKGGGELWEHLDERTIGELMDDDGVTVRGILTIEPDDTLIEIAARMVDARTQIARVSGSANDAPTFVTLPSVMSAILGYWAGTGPESRSE
ncbi:MAG: CBS domain-containing protein [Actinomycetota bacterium]|nr:CBS domain-containing protein [Actinomycetota bacterium]